MGEKQQFSVNLDADLVRRIRHRAIDAQQSLSDFLTEVLTAHLDSDSGVRLQPMVHVADLASALDFYEAVGAQLVHGSREGDFALLRLGASELSLLAHPPNPEQDEGMVELNFVTDEDLGAVEERLRERGVRVVSPASDEGFGAQLQVASPDGLLVKINRLEPELYTQPGLDFLRPVRAAPEKSRP